MLIYADSRVASYTSGDSSRRRGKNRQTSEISDPCVSDTQAHDNIYRASAAEMMLDSRLSPDRFAVATAGARRCEQETIGFPSRCVALSP